MKLQKIEFPLFHDDRGDLNVVELKDYVDWEVKRMYYVTSVVSDRGGHCVKGEKKIYTCMKGKVLARFYDGENWYEFNLEGPSQAVLMEGDYWREFVDFSSDCVLTILSSMNYEAEKYIFDMNEYLAYKEIAEN